MKFGKGNFNDGCGDYGMKAFLATGNENFICCARGSSRIFEENVSHKNIETDLDRRGREKYFRQRDLLQLKEFYNPVKRGDFS